MNIPGQRGFFGAKLSVGTPEQPIRAELFSVERLEQHAESLARAQVLAPPLSAGRPVARRLYDNTNVLIETYRRIVKATHVHQPITPAAEWLLDNFHVVDEQIREIKQDLPPGYYRKLPKLADGPLKGFPRVFGVAWAIVAHTDSALDLERLTRFVEAYQRVQALTIGEVWAIAITLRITLVENLRRLAEAIVERLVASHLADELADRILGTADKDPEPWAGVRQNLALAPWSTAFAVQLAQRLRDRDPNATPALHWLNERLAAEGTSTDQIVREELQVQSATNVTVRNVITSMRLVSMLNWAEFVESINRIDAILRGGSDFAAMDFPTRDLYRRAVEDLSRASGREESEVAERALAAATRSRTVTRDARENDPGYFLISRGRRSFEEELGCRIPLRTRVFRLNSALGIMSYVGLIAIVTALILPIAILSMMHAGITGWVLAALGIAGAIPASDMAVALVNRIITQRVGGSLLPALELRDGVPLELRAIVVVPTLLTVQSRVERQIERLEVHYLSNADENLSFALLSDWTDSQTEHAANDEALLGAAVQGIASLNARYPRTSSEDRFFLLHRGRIWNDGEQKWIGWERKRGKLHELDRLLRGASDTTFLALDGRPPSLPAGTRYVITLDADTRMPIGVARRLVGKMAHPLNQPRFDPRSRLVVEGHAILQPRVTPSLSIGSEGSLFQRVFSGPNGLDPYAFVTADVYQDLFGEGTYSGKGIYEVDSFEAALEGRIPDSTVLSHDLLEGTLARAGLVSDIEFVEEYPARYNVAAARQHRWVRGDWQLLPWIFGRGPKPAGGSVDTAIPLMGRWKMLDNLRRSLSAPSALLAMLIGWLLPASAAASWTVYILLTIALPSLLPALAGMLPRSQGMPLRTHLRTLGGDFATGLLQSAFLITFLAHQAWTMVDAVTRTLHRLFIRRRRLLEWVTMSQSNDDSQFDPRSLIAQIGASVAFAVFVAIVMAFARTHTWPIATPFAALWVLSPLAARWASLPPPESGHLSIAPQDAVTLRLIARRSWRYFEKFVTAEDNSLPPDNFQEDPKPVVAHRTSPTNVGLYLLSIVAARDFGWLGTLDAMDRLDATLVTLQKLDRYRGHFYNWYDTSDLRALEPKYISSVDSGNLAGHLIAVGNACHEIAAQPVLNARWLDGVADNFALLVESAHTPLERGPPVKLPVQLSAALDVFAGLLRDPPSKSTETAQCLARIADAADTICELARLWSVERRNAVGGECSVVVWADSLRACVLSHRRDFGTLMPWAHFVGEQGNPIDSLGHPDATLSLAQLSAYCVTAVRRMAPGGRPGELEQNPVDLITAFEKSASAAQLTTDRLSVLADLTKSMFTAMEFGFLLDPGRQLLSIGYRESDGSIDANFYDLLASEARLASFVAIAKGDIPAKHWFRLGRTLTPINSGAGLISWSGSMFEYLMPSLVMRAPSGSLLEQTNRLVVHRQEEYGAELGVPWGMSESLYNARDIEHTYQYSGFGVPNLGYKRGLAENTVIAPYASGLAAMVNPASAARNFKRMAMLGARGPYGWYEALDYTRARLPEGVKYAVIRAWMAHHQGMTVVAIANAVHEGTMRARFHAEPIIQAAELLLQERIPREVAVARPPPEETRETATVASLLPEIQRRYTSAHSRLPRTHILSNGSRSPAGARMSRVTDGDPMSSCAMSIAGKYGRLVISRVWSNPTHMK
ncbi:MAG TPA: glucoamylase family protein [Rhizomicrobium sp.]